MTRVFNKDEIPKDCDVKLGTGGYRITLTHTPSNKSVTITLFPNPMKGHKYKRLEWKVEGDRFMGKYSSLDSAFREACEQIKTNLEDGVAR